MTERRIVVPGTRLILALGLLGLLSGCTGMSSKASVDKGLLPSPMRADASANASPVTVPETPASEASIPDKLRVPEIPCLWPVDQQDHIILSSFGYRGRRRGGPGSFHRAVDIRTKMNDPVIAAASGTVKKASSGGNYGKLVLVDHGNGYESLYAHLNEITVEPGQKVACGEQLGLAGQTGNATCPHLHYEILHGTDAVNPASFLPMDGTHIEQLASLTPPAMPTLSEKATDKISRKGSAKAEKEEKATKNGKKRTTTSVAKKTSKTAIGKGKDKATEPEVESAPASEAKPIKTASVEKKTAPEAKSKTAPEAKSKAAPAAKSKKTPEGKSKTVATAKSKKASAPASKSTSTAKSAAAKSQKPKTEAASQKTSAAKTTKKTAAPAPKTAAGKKAKS